MKNHKGKVIVIGGDNGGGNRGDELMCEAACHFFSVNAPELDIVTDAQVPSWISPIPGVRIIPQVRFDEKWPSLDRFRKALAKSSRFFCLPLAVDYDCLRVVVRHGTEFLDELQHTSALFFSGCGCLTDKYPGSLLAWRAMILAAERRGIPVVISGIGGGPFRNRILKHLLKSCFSIPRLVTCREATVTPKILRDLGVPHNRIIPVPDDAVFYYPVAAEEAKEWLVKTTSLKLHSGFVGISLMSSVFRSNRSNAVRLGEALSRALPGVQKLYVALSPDDLEMLSLAASADPCACIMPLSSPGITKAVIGNALAMISCRYHGCVFALSQGVPTVGIYSEEYWRLKNAGVMRAFDWDGPVLSIDETFGPALKNTLMKVLNRRDGICKSLRRTVDKLRPLAYYAHRKTLELIYE